FSGRVSEGAAGWSRWGSPMGGGPEHSDVVRASCLLTFPEATQVEPVPVDAWYLHAAGRTFLRRLARDRVGDDMKISLVMQRREPDGKRRYISVQDDATLKHALEETFENEDQVLVLHVISLEDVASARNIHVRPETNPNVSPEPVPPLGMVFPTLSLDGLRESRDFRDDSHMTLAQSLYVGGKEPASSGLEAKPMAHSTSSLADARPSWRPIPEVDYTQSHAARQSNSRSGEAPAAAPAQLTGSRYFISTSWHLQAEEMSSSMRLSNPSTPRSGMRTEGHGSDRWIDVKEFLASKASTAAATFKMASVTGSVVNVQTVGQFDEVTAKESTLSITFFWADFHDLCRPNGQIDVVFRQLATLHPRIRFLKVAAEDVPELSERFEIAVVPTFVVAQGKSVLEKLEGANVAELAKRVDVLSKSVAKKEAEGEVASKTVDEALEYRLKKLINASPVMLFMKGNPTEPKCGFSRQAVALLNEEGIQYGTFDILSDDQVRQGLKLFSNWPTYPQLYVNGTLVGGLDILKEMKSEDSLAEELGLTKNVEEAEAAFNESLKALVNSAPVLLFMKGSPSEPKCGFSRKTVALLREHQIAFSSFDILSDEQVRQGLKKFSNWPTYPQLYVKGKLIGGLDILNEMADEGDLSEQLGVAKKVKKENKYEQLINRAPVMVFIKGSPKAPQCGFSRQLIDILDSEGFQYGYFDILTDDSIRQGLKKYSNWPTFPQLYVRGELIGGLDIVQQLQEDGELAELKP
ncbi:TPA: hypothetical protein N0F65_008018, partial [Lagenidium giganteum]